jgi:hypothetical protein
MMMLFGLPNPFAKDNIYFLQWKNSIQTVLPHKSLHSFGGMYVIPLSLAINQTRIANSEAALAPTQSLLRFGVPWRCSKTNGYCLKYGEMLGNVLLMERFPFHYSKRTFDFFTPSINNKTEL